MRRSDFIYWDKTMRSYGMWLRDSRSTPGNRLGFSGDCAFDGMPLHINGKAKIPLRFRLTPEFEQIHQKVLILGPKEQGLIDKRWLRWMEFDHIAKLLGKSTRTVYRHAGEVLEYISHH